MPEPVACPPAQATTLVGSPVVAERWADLTLAIALYPETNSRALRAVATFVDSLREDVDAAAAAVEITFTSAAVWVGEQSFELRSGSNLGWLKERLDRADLSGVAFSKNADAPSLLAFTKRLLDLHRQRTQVLDFARAWPDAYAGITLIERRFEGAFAEDGDATPRPPVRSGPARRARSIEDVLARDERVRARIDAIQATILANAPTEAQSCRIDMISEIVDLLPTEALRDPAKAADLTEKVLATLETELSGGVRPGVMTQGDNVAFRQLLFVISRSHFSTANPQGNAGAPTGRVAPTPPRTAPLRDDEFREDLEALLAETEQLGPPVSGDLAPSRVEDPLEQLGVYLHYLVAAVDPDRLPSLRTSMTPALEASGSDGVDLLRHYLAPPLAGVDAGPENRVRVATWLRRHGHRERLKTCGMLDGGWAAREFPEGFLSYLETLDLGDPLDLAELDRACRDIGRQRFKSARDLVAAPDFLAGPIPARLFRLSCGSITPFLRLIYDGDRHRYKIDFARFLGATTTNPIDKAIVEVGIDADCLLLDYLSALADNDAAKPGTQRNLAVWAVLAATEGKPGKIDLYARAIRLLAHFDTRETHGYLRKVAGQREFLVFKKHPREARRAAAGAIKALRDRKGPKRV